jgi:hypothetical protein
MYGRDKPALAALNDLPVPHQLAASASATSGSAKPKPATAKPAVAKPAKPAAIGSKPVTAAAKPAAHGQSSGAPTVALNRPQTH